MTEHEVREAARTFIYSHLAERGLPPRSDALATQLRISPAEARGVLRALAERKALVLDPATGEIWMAGPFSAVPTPFRVHGARTSWWANCAWDMLGIPASLGEPARIDAVCGDCGAPVEIEVHAEQGPIAGAGLVHLLLPARRWYDDIGFT